MRYRFSWHFRGDDVHTLKGKASLRISWDGCDSGWIVDDIPIKPEKTLEKRKEYLESIVSRSFDICSRALAQEIYPKISMHLEKPPAGSP